MSFVTASLCEHRETATDSGCPAERSPVGVALPGHVDLLQLHQLRGRLDDLQRKVHARDHQEDRQRHR